ncbi:exportin-5-like [Sitophilus oryzae]|uniref:Exportin-5-like n=1 Tax=Sitophilus oryzae TaxID=7048 RepID=A0A6J2X2V2_SITOR|nr:exportin-5-like [Sitophilus oryzae]XP_030745534.1 exportin-5-like [Sitophilus oryzae]
MAGTDVAALAADLAKAVELTLSPNASQADRLKAYQACESFKETSPLCAEAGLFLAAATQHSLISRHFGLQLMEHTVKYRWTQISQQEKIFIKENAMKLLAAGGISDEPHMKDALSRVIVEMVKREWPQQWPGLLNELSDACGCGEVQTELVLFVFLRLVEDVALLQTLESNQRRKDIYHALTANMSLIFEFFLRLIELHVSQLRSCSETNSNKAIAHSRVVHVVLLTLTGFVEWVSMTHIMAQNGRLLQILCLLLNDIAFQYSAAECLAQIVSRKGKIEERKPLMMLLNTETMQCLLTVAKNPGSILDEQFYLFKKKLLQVLGGLTIQLCTLWSKDPTYRPVNFNMFLEAILAYSNHPSLCLAHAANPLWNSMLKHEHIVRDPMFLSCIPQWVQCTAPKIVKFNYSQEKHPVGSELSETVAYAKIDFDSEEEFSAFFYRCRSDFLNSFRAATLVAPLITFNYVEQWLIKCLSVPNTSYGLSQTDPFFQEWEALANFLESVLSRVLQAHERPPIPAGLHLLQMCLTYQPTDPLIMSTLLTCISALFVFLSMSTGQMAPAVNSVAVSGAALLPQVLEKIFSTLVYVPDGQSKDGRSRALKNVRRHAASLMVKIGNKYPLLLLPVFDQIRATVENLSRPDGSANLSTLEKVTLLEALLLISNHFGDYERQSTFAGEIVHEANAQFLAIVNSGALKGAAEFISFIGLNKPAVPTNTDNICGQNRSNLFFCVNLVLGAIKRCSWPDDPERATRGGFVVSLTESGNPVCRNPAAPHVVPLLPHILSLIKIFNELFTPEAQSLIHDSYKGCLAMPETEKSNLLGLIGHSSDCGDNLGIQSPLERMQRFLTTLHESCYHMIGSMGPSLGRDLYNISDLALAITNSVLAYLQYVPDYRLRPIIRVFMKSFVFSCPAPYYEVVLLPVLAHISPILLNRLHENWQRVIEFRNREVQEDNADTQEVLEDFLTRALTREYLDVLKVALVGGSLTPESNSETMETEELSNSPTPPPTRSNLTSEVISDLGLILLRSDKTCQSIVLAVLGGLSWIDSNASLKATLLTGPIVRQLTIDASLNGEMATHIMAAVLNALILHGQHEANQGSLLTLGAQIYELLRPSFIEVLRVMQQIPGVNPVDLQKLDERISGSTSKGNRIEKVKKDLFKKITGNLIGKSVGQLFKKEVKINNLPQIIINKKEQKDIVPDLRTLYNSS